VNIFIKYCIVYAVRRIKSIPRFLPSHLARALACDGQTSEAELLLLARYATHVAAGMKILEVGSFRGRSCVAIASACQAGVEVVSVDPYLPISSAEKGRQFEFGAADKEICLINLLLSRVARKVRLMQCVSAPVAQYLGQDDCIQMMFIDGDHSYEGVTADFNLWFPVLQLGGVIMFHDSINRHESWGVWRLMDELKTRNDLELVEAVESISVFRKTGIKPQG
jgi:predicted O-methyltransferase YrrM